MPCKQTLYAQRVRSELINKMGGVCVDCGADDQDKLEFDHVHGRDYEPKKLSYSARLARYRREFEAGLLRLLCADCNKKRRKINDNGQYVPTASVIPRTVEMDVAL